MSSQIIGNFIAALVLGKLTQSSYVIMMSVLTLLSTLLFIFLGNPVKIIAQNEKTLFESTPREKNLT